MNDLSIDRTNRVPLRCTAIRHAGERPCSRSCFPDRFFFKVNRKQGEKEKPMIEPEYEISGVDRCMSNAGTVFDWKFFLRKGRGERVCSLDWTIALLWM